MEIIPGGRRVLGLLFLLSVKGRVPNSLNSLRKYYVHNQAKLNWLCEIQLKMTVQALRSHFKQKRESSNNIKCDYVIETSLDILG